MCIQYVYKHTHIKYVHSYTAKRDKGLNSRSAFNDDKN